MIHYDWFSINVTLNVYTSSKNWKIKDFHFKLISNFVFKIIGMRLEFSYAVVLWYTQGTRRAGNEK